MCCSTGLPATGAIGFGITPVSGKSLVPLPAAKTIAFMNPTSLVMYECLRLLPAQPAALIRAGPSPTSTSTAPGPTSLPAHLASLGSRLCYAAPGTGVVGGIHGVAGLSSKKTATPALCPYSQESLHVLQGGGGYVDPRVEVLDPIHRNLAYAQTSLLGQQEQLGVEEPLVVL